MPTQDDQFVALGPTDVGFKTFGSNIASGGEFIGTQTGVFCQGGNGFAVQAFGNVNDDAAVIALNSASRGLGVRAGGGATAEGVFASGGTNGVHGKTSSQNDSGVFGENLSGGSGVSGSSLTGDGVLGAGKNGVHGRSTSPSDSGVWGENTNGGFGVSGSTNAGSGSEGTIAAVWGSNSGAGAGVRGTCLGGAGILGEGAIAVSGRGSIGVQGTSSEKGTLVPTPGVWGEHLAGGTGVLGTSAGPGSVGVFGTGGYGGELNGTQAPLRLDPSNSAGQPTTGNHLVGEFYVDSTGALYYCRSTGTPGTWVKLA